MMFEVVVFGISLLLIACFEGAETSFVSSDKVALIVDRRDSFRFKSSFFFLQNNELFFATVVVATNLFMTLFSSTAEILFHENLHLEMPIVLLLTTVVGFLFGELIPKSVALERSEASAKILMPVVNTFYIIARPLVKLTADVSTFMAGLLFSPSSKPAIFQRRDVYRFLGNTAGGGYMDKIESDMIRKLVANAGLPVRSIAVPRTDIVAARLGTGINKVRELFEKSGKTKVVVYDSSIDNVVGVVYAKDIFREVEVIDELVSDVLFVPENMSVIDLLEEFRTEKVYLAILIDEFGGTSGLVTSSDVMELFLGEVAIRNSEEKIKRLNPKQYILKGNTEIGELESLLKVKFPPGEYSTMAGLLILTLGRIPSRGEKIILGHVEVQVLESDGRRLDELKVTLK
ncbi:MAG: hemolysin family protein [Bacteroidetes bacterium]|jgi:CBS domain containing-hemolysin-like protein|nr:hemolysin family protein [Bacteroidota bacterium]